MGSNMVPNVWCVESINISCANFIWWLQWLVGHSLLCSLVLLIRKLRSYNISIFAFFFFDCLDYNWLFCMSLVIFRLYAYCYTSLSSPHRNFTLLFYLIIKVMCSHCKKKKKWKSVEKELEPSPLTMNILLPLSFFPFLKKRYFVYPP